MNKEELSNLTHEDLVEKILLMQQSYDMLTDSMAALVAADDDADYNNAVIDQMGQSLFYGLMDGIVDSMLQEKEDKQYRAEEREAVLKNLTNWWMRYLHDQGIRVDRVNYADAEFDPTALKNLFDDGVDEFEDEDD